MDAAEFLQCRSALGAAAGRSGDLIRAVDDMRLPVPGSAWTVGEAAAHLVIGLRGYTDAACGEAKQWLELTPPAGSYSERVTGLNALTVAAEPERDPAGAAEAIAGGVGEFLAATEPLGPSEAIPTPWYAEEATLSVAEATALLLGEQLVHGHDIARAGGRTPQWPIPPEEARLALRGVPPMMSLAADPVRVAGLTATYQVRIGRVPAFVVRVADGKVVAEPVGSQPVDCYLAADPVALLLVGYGRMSQWRAVARGDLLAWGRRPWLGLRFKSLFVNP